MAIVDTTGSMVSTLDAANLAYEFEKVRTKMPEVKKREDLVQKAQREKVIPSNLEYFVNVILSKCNKNQYYN